MLSKNMVNAINNQINKEYFSAYLYQSMGAWATAEGWTGLAIWMDVQVQEETAHFKKFYNYLNQQSERVLLQAIAQPETEFESIKEIFEKTLEHEKTITQSINELVSLAKKEEDHATEIFLQWFVTEQIEEEANAKEILQILKLSGKDSSSLFMLNNQLATRVFTPPVQG